jgi:uncharacterized Ntn-hydrolase superfamily protein
MLLKRGLLSIALILAVQSSLFATWSIVAVDAATGQVVIASATCLPPDVFPQMGVKDLRDIQAAVVPGKGGGVCQSALDPTKTNQKLIVSELGKGTAPDRILSLLKAQDREVESRQFGILDMSGQSVGFSGRETLAVALFESGNVGANIHFQIQGNILARDEVIHAAARAMSRTSGSLSDRVMAAMEGRRRQTVATEDAPVAEPRASPTF